MLPWLGSLLDRIFVSLVGSSGSLLNTVCLAVCNAPVQGKSLAEKEVDQVGLEGRTRSLVIASHAQGWYRLRGEQIAQAVNISCQSQ
jgi:hypothetical protein